MQLDLGMSSSLSTYILYTSGLKTYSFQGFVTKYFVTKDLMPSLMFMCQGKNQVA